MWADVRSDSFVLRFKRVQVDMYSEFRGFRLMFVQTEEGSG